MNLLFINIANFEITSKNSYCREVLAAFKPHFNKIHVFCFGNNEIIKKDNIIYYCGNFGFWNRHFKQLKHKISAVHAQDLFIGGWKAIGYSKQTRAPLTVRCGGVWKYKLDSPIKALKHLAARITEGRVLKHADRIVFNTKQLQEHYSKHSEKSSVVYNGVDTNVFKPTKKRNSSKLRLLFIGRISKEKGILELVEAAGNDKEIEVSLVGEGPLQVSIKAGNFNLLGRKAHKEIAELMKHHDALVLPSYSEGMANVVLEAMSCGLPTIVTDVGGMSEICNSGNSILIQPKSTLQLKQGISTIKDKAVREKLGNNARKTVEKIDLDSQRILLHNALFEHLNFKTNKTLIFWDYELQKGMDMSMSGIKHTGFDEYKQTNKILDLCKEHGVKCVFAALGWIAMKGELPYHSQEQLKRIVREGHELGSHSMGHENLAELSEEEIIKSLRESKKLLQEVTGSKVRTFVPPHNMPYDIFGFSVYKPPNQLIKFSKVSLRKILRLAENQGYEVYRAYKITLRRLLKIPFSLQARKRNNFTTIFLQGDSGFGESAIKNIFQAGSLGNYGIVYGHPQATLNEGDENLSTFEKFLDERLDNNIEIVTTEVFN